MARKKKTTVAVISKDWQLRALVRAQLLEEGFEATGIESVADLIQLLTWNQVRADLILLDPDDQELDEAAVSELRRLTHHAPIIAVLRPTVAAERVVTLLRPARVLYRPLTVRDAVDAIRRLASGRPGE